MSASRTSRTQNGCCSGCYADSGKLTSNGGEALAHIRSTVDTPACDVQLIFTPGDARADPRGGRFAARVVRVGHSYWTPKSRGSVLIRSSDPATPPAIRMNLLTEREDVEALVRAVQRTREIIATEPIASTVERELLPGAGRGYRGLSSGTPRSRPAIRRAASRWAVNPTVLSTRGSASAVSTTFASPTPRRYPRFPAPTPTLLRS